MYAAHQLWLERMTVIGGAALAVVALLAWQVDGGAEPAPATVNVTMSSSADMAVEPVAGAHSAELRASDAAASTERRATILNATGGTGVFRVVADPTTRDLDELLAIRIAVGGTSVFDGTLGDLREGSAAFELASHQKTDLTAILRLPVEEETAWRGRSVDVRLRFETVDAAR